MSTDLARWQKLYPGAVNVGVAAGTKHLVTAELKKMQQRGEVLPQWRFAREVKPGVIEIPYVRLKERSAVRRKQVLRVAGMTAGALVFLGGVSYALWTIRYLIAAVAALMILGALVFVWPHAKNGCTGLHCTGCRG